MADATVILLPEIIEPGQRELHWWRVADGAVVARGADAGWLEWAGGDTAVVALAPTAAVRLEFAEAGDSTTPRQALAVARLSALDQSLGETDALHAVAAPGPDGSRRMVTAIVDNGVMLAWLDWAEGVGVQIHRVVPAATLLPLQDEWVAADIGSDHPVGRWGLVLPNEPELAAALLAGEDARQLDPAEVDDAIAASAESPLIDLRTGRFARRRRRRLDRSRIRELVVLAALIPIITLLWAIASIVQIERSIRRLDADTVEVAETALGRPVALATAEAELRQRSGVGPAGGFTAPLSALYNGLQPEPAVSATQLAYTRDGTLSTTLAAPTLDGINRVIVGLQRNGYRITAVPRQAPDGRAMADVTVRSGP